MAEQPQGLPAQSTRAVTPGAGFGMLLRTEARNVLGVRHVWLLVLLPTALALVSMWFPTFPEPVYSFFARVFDLGSWSEIVLLNAYTGLFFVLYWVGVFDVTRIYVQPYEDRNLIFSLSKPVRALAYVAARFLPIAAALIVCGAATAGACLAAMSSVGLNYQAGDVLWASALSITLAVVVLALVTFLMLFARDTYTAIGIAFLPMFVFFLPAAMYVYRPDVFDAAPRAKQLLVFPANVIWHSDLLTWAAMPLIGALAAAAGVLVLLTGMVLARRTIG